MHRESCYDCYKEPERVEMSVRKAIGIQLYGATCTAVIPGLMRAVTPHSAECHDLVKIDFYTFFDMQ